MTSHWVVMLRLKPQSNWTVYGKVFTDKAKAQDVARKHIKDGYNAVSVIFVEPDLGVL